MTLISTVNVGAGGQAAIEWTGIPQTGQDLLVVLSGRSTRGFGADLIGAQFNGETATTNYSNRRLLGNGSTASSDTTWPQLIGVVNASTSTANVFSNCSVYVPNYASTTTKSISCDSVYEDNVTYAEAHIIAAKWTATSGISSVKLLSVLGANNFVQYSTASLYTISTTGATGATVA